MVRPFVNWGKTVKTRPSAWHAPASEDEIIELVRAAARDHQHVRVVGAGHSWSAIAAPEQIGVTLDRHAGLVELDEANLRVSVRAGTRLRDLNAALDAAGFALPILGSIAVQSIAGLAATGTHGSSLVHGNIASGIDRMRLIDGRGNVVELAGETLDGARVHLGALGVVAQVRLRIVPRFSLAETVERVPVDELAKNLDAIAASAEFVKVWWMPHTRWAYIFRHERCTEAMTRKPNPARQRWIDDNIMHAWVFPFVLRAGGLLGLTAPISRRVAGTLMQPRRVGPSTLMLSTPMPAKHRETEGAMPMSRAPEAVDRTIRLIERDKLTVNFITEIRFVKADGGWVSPAHGVDTCQLGAYCHGARATPYFAAFWREMRELGGVRPHWGKELDHTADEVRALWPELPRFLALRDELDPERVFGGTFHTRVLGP